MNSDSMHPELMKVVERAVRPVRAARDRKLRMRQELLVHLTAICEEERVRTGDETAAFEAARSRFGDPAELSRELDRSVSFWGRLAWLDTTMEEGLETLFGYREDRSLAWHFGRTFLTSTGVGAAMAALIALTAFLFPERQVDWVGTASLLPVLLFIVGLTFVVHFSAIVLVTDFYDRERPRWGRAVLHASACVVALTVVFYVVWWSILGDVSYILPQLPVAALVHSMIPAGLILVVWSSEAKARPHREWARLRLEE